ncbi:MAG: ABC transporter ATP-binding protein [Oscillospiraceae bacterium]|nr:ABC transporter ATP-binding protein [Oscillospiraceae bacterium]
MIKAQNVVKTFDGHRALDGLNITVPKGAIYGLVGPNGAGKSTIIRHLAGIYRQDSGEVMIDGEKVFENPALKGRIAYIPDDLYFFLQANIRDMMRFYRGVYPNFSMERYNKLRDVFELDEKRSMRHLSKGMQKQAAFWLAMSCCPDVLILDEPVDGLDPVMRRQVWSLVMGEVTERGTTVLVSSHNLRELEDVCDHVGIIHKGKTVLEHSLSELQDNIVKVQIVYPEGGDLPENLNVLHEAQSGRVRTVIIRGTMDEVETALKASNPVFYDMIPLTLEEIFIYEMGGAAYEIKDVIL